MSTATSQSPVVSYGTRPPLGRRVNWRMVTVVSVIAILVGFPVYTFVKAQLNHGIEQVGNGFYVDLKAMGNFSFDDHAGTLADVPAEFRTLDGKQVTLDGYMYSDQSAADQLNNFQFVYNVNKCCFGGPPKVQERVFAVVPHKGMVYNLGQFTMVRLTGTMHVEIVRDSGGTISSVYRLDVAKQPEPLS